MIKDTKKTKTTTSASTSTSVGAAGKTPMTFEESVKLYASLAGSSVGGAVYTQQDADAAVQNVYQQLLGRNAQGAEYTKALNLAMGQSKDTSVSGRMQAIQDYVMGQPEYIARSQNRWLDAIYNDMQKKIARARQ